MQRHTPSSFPRHPNKFRYFRRCCAHRIDPMRGGVDTKEVVSKARAETPRAGPKREPDIDSATQPEGWRSPNCRPHKVQIIVAGKRAKAAEPKRRHAVARRFSEKRPKSHGQMMARPG